MKSGNKNRPFVPGNHGMGPITHIDRCPWCRRKKNLTFIEFYSFGDYDQSERAWPIAYPREDRPLTGIVTHTGCGPGTGYWIDLDYLSSDLNGWIEHIEEKDWGAPSAIRSSAKLILMDAVDIHRPRI